MAGYQRQALPNIQPDLVINAEDLNAEFNQVQAAFHNSTGHKHDGSTGEGPKISLTAAVSGILPIVNGGTGASNAASARTNLGLGTLSTLSPTGTASASTWLRGDGVWSSVLMQNQGALGASEDLNTYTSIGVWTQNTNAGATNGTNYPENVAGMLIVYEGPSSNIRTVQEYITYSSNKHYRRVATSGPAWSVWKEIPSTAVATTSVDGLMSSADKTKLDGIAAGANVTPPFGTTSGTIAEGNDSRIVNAVPNTRTVTAGTGLTGGGELSSNVTLNVSYGTAAGTAAQGNDSRIVNAVPNTRTITAGNGLTGGGALSANQTITLGTPGTLTNSTTNAVTTTSHTHAISLSAADVGAPPTSRSIIAGNGLTGGGTLAADRTLSVGAGTGITVAATTVSVNYGTTSTTACVGNDARLSNSREWTASTVSQAEAEAGTATTRRAWTAQRVAQAIAALSPPGIGIGQQWQDVTRNPDTSYQNTTGKTLQVFWTGSAGSNGSYTVEVSHNGSSWLTMFTIGSSAKDVAIIIPSGHYYRFVKNLNPTNTPNVKELR